MSQSNKSRYEVGESGQPRIGLKKFLPERIVRRMKDFYDAGHVNFRVFCERMVAVNQQGGQGEQG